MPPPRSPQPTASPDGVQDREEGQVDEERLRLSHQFGQDRAAQGFQEAPERPHAAVQGGWVHPRNSREVDEEPPGVAQEGVLALDAPKLLQERQRQDLRIRKLLERLEARGVGVEGGVGILDEAITARLWPLPGERAAGYAVDEPSGAPLVG